MYNQNDCNQNEVVGCACHCWTLSALDVYLKTFLAFGNLWHRCKNPILLMMSMQLQLYVRHQGRLQYQRTCSMKKLRLATTFGKFSFQVNSTWLKILHIVKKRYQVRFHFVENCHSNRCHKAQTQTIFYESDGEFPPNLFLACACDSANEKTKNEHEAQSRRSYSDIYSL